MTHTRPPFRTALKRGLQGRCPRCGEGDLFKKALEIHERCASCGLRYQPNHGDTWMFMIITDRLPIFLGIVLVYFGFQATNFLTTLAFFAAIAAPLIATMRPRQGLALALDYLTRTSAHGTSDDEVYGAPSRHSA